MKRIAFALTLILPFVGIQNTYAKGDVSNYQSTDETNLVEHRHYVNRDGKTIHSPAHSKNGATPSGATAVCRDGSYSFSQHHRGTCSRHHGVKNWL